MDEPLSNLDAKLRTEMRNAIKQIQQQVGITTVYVTHDQEEALAVSDRIAVMNGGVIQQIDTLKHIYQRPANIFVSTFIGLSNVINGVLESNDNGKAQVRIGDYRFTMSNIKKECTQGPVKVSIRPEEFIINKETKEGIPVVVKSSVFLGVATHYFLETKDGQDIEVIQDSDLEELIPNGTLIHLKVQTQKINVFSEDGSRSYIDRGGRA